MKFRLFFLIGSTTLVFLFLGYNIYSLQITKAEYYTQRAKAQAANNEEKFPDRNPIYFSGKIPAALDRDLAVVYAVPTQIDDVTEVSQRLLAAAGLEPEVTIPLLSKKDDQYEELIEKATGEQVRAINSAEIPGIYVTTERGRQYPFNELASHVIGFTQQADKKTAPAGKYGIEAMYNEEILESAVELTIDANIQKKAEEILKGLVEEWHPTGATVIVQDPKTGKILALGNYPTFDPNDFSKSSLSSFINPAIQNVYEPGSIAKVITMASAIDAGAVEPGTIYNDKGFYTADGKTVKNWDLKAHGNITMTNVIENSVNTGTVFAEQKMGHRAFYDYLVKFGFKEATGIDLPGEVVGRLTPLETYPRDINFATASYGQGISVTPIRLITAVSAIANKGVMNQPYITTTAVSDFNRRVISEEAAAKVSAMMVSAVDKAKVARIPHYRVAGKTGTAYIPDFEKGGYTDNVINTYVGFAPATDARFTILLKLDDPKDAPLAGQTVVPAFRELAEFILNYYDIPPDSTN